MADKPLVREKLYTEKQLKNPNYAHEELERRKARVSSPMTPVQKKGK